MPAFFSSVRPALLAALLLTVTLFTACGLKGPLQPPIPVNTPPTDASQASQKAPTATQAAPTQQQTQPRQARPVR